jgi:transposase
MIALPAGAQVWLAAGSTDMRKGFDGLAALVQTQLAEDPFSGQLFVFRGRGGDRVKILWWSGDGLCLFAKRLERGRFVWPQATHGTVALSAAQLSMLLEGIDWERRVTDARQRVRVPHDEGVANHIDPESCGDVREDGAEALTGARVGQVLSGERLLFRSADVIQSTEGNRLVASSQATGRSASSEDLGMRVRLALGNREISGLLTASRAVGRGVEAATP